MITKIYLRKELDNNEKRTPIVPDDIKILILNGFEIWIEKDFFHASILQMKNIYKLFSSNYRTIY